MNEPAPRIYSAEYYDRLRAIEGTHWWVLGMDDIMLGLLSRQLNGRRVGRALDLGCGSGTGLSWLQAHLSPEFTVGVDVSLHGLQHSGGRGAALVCASAGRIPVAGNSLDLVLCNDVLQHLADDRAALEEIYRVLAPGGLVYLRTNCRFLMPLQPGCLRLYTRRRLRGVLAAVGFEPLTVSRANALGSVISVARLYLPARGASVPHHNEGGGLRIAPPDAAAPGRVEKLMRGTLRTEARLMGNSDRLIPFGHSLVALARKPTSAG